jgi:hypothetical protein
MITTEPVSGAMYNTRQPQLATTVQKSRLWSQEQGDVWRRRIVKIDMNVTITPGATIEEGSAGSLGS